jgi:acyl-CoA synthetase (AMP-forming)/AMP-acid ligase II
MKSFCNQNLPAYMNPDIFVFVDSLPRTSTNKVDYQTLIRRFQASEMGAGRPEMGDSRASAKAPGVSV